MKDKRMWIIFLIIFINMFGFGIILPLLPYYVESFGAGPITIGLISAVYSLFQLISAPILGELSDKFGRRPVLLFSIGGTALSFGILGIANSIPLLFLSRVIDGASGGNISTAQAYIADITSKENRTQGMGMMMAAFSLGFILGPALGGILSVYGYAVPAFVAGVVALIATILTYFFLPESLKANVASKTVAKKRRKIFSLQDFYDALTHPEVGLFLSISFMTMFAFSLMQGTFALFSEHSLHLTAKDNGYIFAYLGFVGIMMQMFFLKRLLRWIPERKAIFVSIISMAIALGLIAFSANMILLFVAVTLLAFSNSISGPVLAGLISKKTPDHEQGNIAGMSQSVGSMSRLLGPVMGTFIYSQLGLRAPFLLATVVLGMTALFSIKHLLFTSEQE
jgi:DHA1 family tetracycline resistance protein-like MFS transporter